MNSDPTFVLGYDGGKKLKMVKEGSKNQFVFQTAIEYLNKVGQ